MEFLNRRLLASEAWPGRLFLFSRIPSNRKTLRLPFQWPEDLAVAGRIIWIVESSNLDKRFRVHGIDLDVRRFVSTFKAPDPGISRLAWDGRSL